MVAITFPLTHSPGLKASEGAGRLYGCYAEPLGEGARAAAVLHRSPGLVGWGTTSKSGYRGSIEVQGSYIPPSAAFSKSIRLLGAPQRLSEP